MFDPENFLKVCDNTLGSPSCKSEEYYRTVIGRAYYATFLVAREKLKNMGKLQLPIKARRSVHKLVIEKFGKINEKNISDMLQALKRQRETADYELEKSISQRNATNCYSLSQILINKIKTL